MSVASPGSAVLPAKIDHPEVQLVPLGLGEEGLQVPFGLHHISRLGKAPALGEAVDMGVDREGGHAEGLAHDHARRLVAHARQRLQLREGPRHLAAVPQMPTK